MMQTASIVGRRLRTFSHGHARIVRCNNDTKSASSEATAAAGRYCHHNLPTTTPHSSSSSHQRQQPFSYKIAPSRIFQYPNNRLRLQQHQQQYYSATTTTSTTPSSSAKFAVIDHVQAYESAMQGRHGQALALARLEGIGKDDPPFDPFLEDEKLLQAQQQQQQPVDDDAKIVKEQEEDDDGYHGDISEDEEVEDFDDDEDDDENGPLGSDYNLDGSLRRKKSVLSALRAGYPAGGLFAIVELAGAQHKVTTDDLLVINRLQPIDIFKIGSVHTLEDVMLMGSSHLTLVGMPYVPGAQVDVMVEEITQDAKVIIFKKRRRKNSQRKNGYRRDLTLLRVVDIRLPEEYQNHHHVGRESVEELDPDRTVVTPRIPSPATRTTTVQPDIAPKIAGPMELLAEDGSNDSEIKAQLKTA